MRSRPARSLLACPGCVRPSRAPPARLLTRALQTSVPATTTPSAAPTPPAHPTATLLRQAQDLTRDYPLLEPSLWDSRLEQAVADLGGPRKATVAVMGDAASGADGLVTAAFDDPLASEGELSLALETRRLAEGSPEALQISYAESAAQADGHLAIPSNWLKSHNTDLVEIVHSEAGPLDSSLSVAYTADVLVLVLSELKSLSKPQLSSFLLSLSTKPHLLLALSTSSPFPALAATRAFKAQLDQLLGPSSQPTLAPVQLEQALEALASLVPIDVPEGQAPAPVSFELFEKGYLTSGVPQLRERIVGAVKGMQVPAGEEGVSQLQVETAGYVLEKVISVAANAAGQIEAGLAEGEAEVAQLAFEAAHAEAEARKELGVEDGKLAVPEDELKRSMDALNAMLQERLEWWQLPSRVDDITLEVADEAARSYLVNLEDSLIFRTGRLLAIANKLDEATQALLDSRPFQPPAQAGVHPLASIHSPVLANRIARAALPSSPAALSQTLVARRAQVSAPGGPAELLHARAQKALASAATFSLGSAGAGAWAAVAGLAEVPTAVGCGLLGVTLGAWGLQRGWEKAKRKFRVDVGERVRGGLEVDLGERAGVMVERMGWQARVAVEGSAEALRKRREELEAFRRRLGELDAKRRGV